MAAGLPNRGQQCPRDLSSTTNQEQGDAEAARGRIASRSALTVSHRRNADERGADGEAGSFVARINGIRASQGLDALAIHGELTPWRSGWAEHMAAQGGISHNRNLPNQVSATGTPSARTWAPAPTSTA